MNKKIPYGYHNIDDDDIKAVQNNLSGKYGKTRLIFYSMEEEDILYLHNKNM